MASNTNNPFCVGTKSGLTLRSWMASLNDIPDITFELANVSHKKTKNNRPLNTAEIREALPGLKVQIEYLVPDKIIALGKTAAKALKQCQMEFYELPHPSPLNRLLNDPEYVAGKIKGLKEFIESP